MTARLRKDVYGLPGWRERVNYDHAASTASPRARTPVASRRRPVRVGDDPASTTPREEGLPVRVTLLHQHLGTGGMDERIGELVASRKYDSLRVLMAFAKGTGVGLISPHLEDFIRAGGAVEIIVGLDMDGTSPDALESLVGLGASVFVFGVKGDRTFHPKVLMFESDPADEFAVVVGSNNWTPGGLDSNFEVAIEVAARRSGSASARRLGENIDELWLTYRTPRAPLEPDRHLKQVNAQKLARWSRDMPMGRGTGAPDQHESGLADRLFSAVAEALPRKSLRRPPRRASGIGTGDVSTSGGAGQGRGGLPSTLYLVVAGDETSRGGEIQVPTDALSEYFGVDPNDSLWVTFNHTDGETERNRRVGLYTSNKTYRLSSSRFSTMPRPFVLQLDRVADDEFDVIFHLPRTRGYAAADRLATRGGGASKRWGTA